MEAIDITIEVEDREGNTTTLTAPTDMGLSLMEFLKASESDILWGHGVMCNMLRRCTRR